MQQGQLYHPYSIQSFSLLARTIPAMQQDSAPDNSISRQQSFSKDAVLNTVPTSTTKKRQRPSGPVLLKLPTVLLKRTQQSKAFREGNQLVFTRAVQSIIPVDNNSNKKLQQGDLVFISVAGKGEKGEKINGNEDVNENWSDGSKKDQNSDNVVIGIGTYNDNSLYKVRILVHKYTSMDLFETIQRTCTTSTDAIHAIVTHHIQAAIRLRTSMGLGTKSSSTNSDYTSASATVTDTYRLVNGEGDSLSGLAIDVIGGTVVVIMSSASWSEIYQNEITSVVRKELRTNDVIWKSTPSRLKQDGYTGLDVNEETKNTYDNTNHEYGHDDSNEVLGTAPTQKMIVSKENGIYFETYPYDDGQKTGVYCDQRENRLYVAGLCNNKNVLDLCCYHGGFGITAAIHGNAKSITFVDSSSAAISIATANALRNSVPDEICTFIHADIETFLQDEYRRLDSSSSSASSYYDVIILDPPKLAPSVKVLDRARRKYHSLNRDAFKLINPVDGGLLLSCSCSAAMTCADGGQYFLNTIQGAALASGRHVTLLQKRGAASCHTISPICQPAGAYLTAALFYVHPCTTATIG
jgi:23S rRNA G2069 N7-methylase RlmK/C1962 C5-methylase RlmI